MLNQFKSNHKEGLFGPIVSIYLFIVKEEENAFIHTWQLVKLDLEKAKLWQLRESRHLQKLYISKDLKRKEFWHKNCKSQRWDKLTVHCNCASLTPLLPCPPWLSMLKAVTVGLWWLGSPACLEGFGQGLGDFWAVSRSQGWGLRCSGKFDGSSEHK